MAIQQIGGVHNFVNVKRTVIAEDDCAISATELECFQDR